MHVEILQYREDLTIDEYNVGDVLGGVCFLLLKDHKLLAIPVHEIAGLRNPVPFPKMSNADRKQFVYVTKMLLDSLNENLKKHSTVSQTETATFEKEDYSTLEFRSDAGDVPYPAVLGHREPHQDCYNPAVGVP